MDINLTDREADLMSVLWERGPSTVAEVQASLGDELAYTTVLTILRTLEAKGYVDHTNDGGRAHRYLPLVERAAAQRSALGHLAAKFFKGSTQLLLTHLVSDRKLTEDEVRNIRKLLAQHSKQSKK
jgi:predicted transcriptional regulator